MSRKRLHTRRNPRSNPRGVLSVHGSGFGFVQTAEGGYFIPATKMAGAFDGDLVEVAPLPVQGNKAKQPHQISLKAQRAIDQPAARVVRVVDRAHDTVVGRYEVAEPFGVVVPEDARIPYDIFTMRANHPHVDDGALVRVRITSFPTRNSAATGVVEEVLGRAGDEEMAIDLIVARHKLETTFSEAALEEAEAASLDVQGALAAGYRDLRERFVLTIDPADARDFDDAVSLERVCLPASETLQKDASGAAETCVLGDRGVSSGVRVVDGRGFSAAQWRMGVHIADVAHYVPWNSSIDLDARRRATSVYLVDRVIPMLPEQLSNDLCSLRPGETRRAMTLDLYVDDDARLVAYELYPALVQSDVRLSYDDALQVLESSEDEGATQEGYEVAWRLKVLSRLADARFAARELAGGLDFNTTEAKVRLDGQGYPVEVDLRHKTKATSLIEEAMIFANETVAQYLRDTKFPGLFRVHEKPSADNLAGLIPVLQEFTWFKNIDQQQFVAGNAQIITQALSLSAGRLEGELVSTLVLRSMKRAVYRAVCEPHYGLASDAYVHFTSPIRRYPDLVVHRMIQAQLWGRPERFDQEVSALAWIAEHASSMERVAEKAARESQEYKMVEYMEREVGQTFSAVISGVTSYGVYVRLKNTAEGLVPMKNLGREYFAFDPVLHRLVGQDSGVVYRLGQRLSVVLLSADVVSRRLDFRQAD